MKLKLNQRNRKEKIVWSGDLDDDCSAKWAGLLLRAEWTNDKRWWWAVSDMLNGDMEIDSSNKHSIQVQNGEDARCSAEKAAKQYLLME